jgi:hypothetical protein
MAIIFYSTVRFARTVGSCGTVTNRVATALFVASVSISRAMRKTK